MKRYFIGLIALIIFGMTMSRCKHEVPETDDDQPTDTTAVTLSDTCSLDTIYFVNEILPIFVTQCAGPGCHDAASAADGVILDNYDNIVRTGEIKAFDITEGDVYKRITSTDSDKVMPPGGKLTPEQINAIKVWINQGALNNSCQNTCFADSFSYSKYIWPIVEGSCKSCHRQNNPKGGVSLSNYAEIKQSVDNGGFAGTIFHKSGWKPMPPGGSLDSCSQAKIEKWIAAGAPNN